MMQPTPDHGSGFGILLLFGWLFAVVALLGLLTLAAIASRRWAGRVPSVIRYGAAVVLVAAVAVSGFVLLVSLRAAFLEAAAFLLLVVFLPVALAGFLVRRSVPRARAVDLVATTAVSWSVPFLVGVGVFFTVGTQFTGLVPGGAAVAVVVVVGGTAMAAERAIDVMRLVDRSTGVD